jgi:hypothetical protein
MIATINDNNNHTRKTALPPLINRIAGSRSHNNAAEQARRIPNKMGNSRDAKHHEIATKNNITENALASINDRVATATARPPSVRGCRKAETARAKTELKQNMTKTEGLVCPGLSQTRPYDPSHSSAGMIPQNTAAMKRTVRTVLLTVEVPLCTRFTSTAGIIAATNPRRITRLSIGAPRVSN